MVPAFNFRGSTYHRGVAFEGDLKDLSLGDIFQTIAQNRQTGTLTLSLDEVTRARVFFRGGRIALFSPDDSTGPPWAEVLRRGGAIPDGFLGGVKDGRLRLRSPRGEWVEVDRAGHRAAAERYLADAVADLFRRPGGRFRFDDGEQPRGPFDRDLAAAGAALEPQVVAFEGMRRRDEWPRLARRIRSFEEVFVRRGALDDAAVPAEARKLHALLDGARTLDDCMANLPCGEFGTAAALVELLDRGLCAPASAAELLARAEDAQAAGEDARAERLLRRAALIEPDHRGAREALAGLLERTGRGREAGRLWLALAAERRAAGELERALEDYWRAADLLPGDLEPLERALEIERGRGGGKDGELATGKRLVARLLEAGAPDRAAAVAGEIAARFPEDAEAHERHAAALGALGRAAEAEAARGRAVELRSGRLAERRARRARLWRTLVRAVLVAIVAIAVGREGLALLDLRAATARALAVADPAERRAAREELLRVAERHPFTLAGGEARRLAAASAEDGR